MKYAPRALWGVGLFFGWMSTVLALSSHGLERADGLAPLLRAGFPLSSLVASLLTLGFVGLTALFVVRWRERWTGGALVVLLAWGELMQRMLWPGEAGANRALVLPAVSVLAYLIGQAVAARRGEGRRVAELIGVELACGVAGACYFLAGVTKLRGSGLLWADGSNLSLHMVVHSLKGFAWIRPFRLAVADHIWLCTVMGIGTLIIECGGIAFLVPRLRRVWCVLITLMHLSIALLMGLHHYDWMFVALALGLYGTGGLVDADVQPGAGDARVQEP